MAKVLGEQTRQDLINEYPEAAEIMKELVSQYINQVY